MRPRIFTERFVRPSVYPSIRPLGTIWNRQKHFRYQNTHFKMVFRCSRFREKAEDMGRIRGERFLDDDGG